MLMQRWMALPFGSPMGNLAVLKGLCSDEWITSRRKGGGQMSYVPLAV